MEKEKPPDALISNPRQFKDKLCCSVPWYRNLYLLAGDRGFFFSENHDKRLELTFFKTLPTLLSPWLEHSTLRSLFFSTFAAHIYVDLRTLCFASKANLKRLVKQAVIPELSFPETCNKCKNLS